MGIWTDVKDSAGTVGSKPVEIVAVYSDAQESNAQAVLFRYKDSATINMLRWSVGTPVSLDIDDIEVAKGTLNTMLAVEYRVRDDQDDPLFYGKSIPEILGNALAASIDSEILLMAKILRGTKRGK